MRIAALLAALPVSGALAHPGPGDAAGCHTDAAGRLHCHAEAFGMGEMAALIALLAACAGVAFLLLRRARARAIRKDPR